MVIVTDKHKPLPRAPKGTVVRPQALRAYATEIEARFALCSLSDGVAPFLTESTVIHKSRPRTVKL